MTASGEDHDAAILHKPLVWIDLEMTGLDPARHVIVEAAVVITDGTLETRIEGPDLVIHATEDQLGEMDEVVVDMHSSSGLLARIRSATRTVDQAEREILDFVKAHVPDPRRAPLAGNSVHADRAFLDRYMPDLAAHLHYRNVDVSTVKELAKRWYPDLEPFTKKTTHRALSDIQESIEELSYYRSAVFVPVGEPENRQSPQ